MEIHISSSQIKRRVVRFLKPPEPPIVDPMKEELEKKRDTDQVELKACEDRLQKLQEAMTTTATKVCIEAYKDAVNFLTVKYALPPGVKFKVKLRYDNALDYEKHLIHPRLLIVRDDPEFVTGFRSDVIGELSDVPWTEEMMQLAIQVAQEKYAQVQKHKQFQESEHAMWTYVIDSKYKAKKK